MTLNPLELPNSLFPMFGRSFQSPFNRREDASRRVPNENSRTEEKTHHGTTENPQLRFYSWGLKEIPKPTKSKETQIQHSGNSTSFTSVQERHPPVEYHPHLKSSSAVRVKKVRALHTESRLATLNMKFFNFTKHGFVLTRIGS